MKNNVQLITYVDRLSGSNLKELNNTLCGQLSNLFSGVHLLPFYYPIDGSDAGFDPIDHTKVDSRLGSWEDVRALGDHYDVMVDLIVNHVSAHSAEFKDVLSHGEDSSYWPLFLTKDKVFPDGITIEEQEKIYRPRSGSSFTRFSLPDNKSVEFWTTFTDTQIDIDVTSKAGQSYLTRVLSTFAKNNIKSIRLDAAGYAIKKAGTSCFMLDETFEFIKQLTDMANKLGIETLVEIHSHYQTQIEIAKRVDLVYDFALPPLILHSLFNKDFHALVNWLQISPRNCITVLDTHDGIGMIDVGPMAGQAGLLTNEEIDSIVDKIRINSSEESKKATGCSASNVDLYQINCTYYDALGKNDYDCLIARAIQFFAPGIPQVYYTGLLAETNDMNLLLKTNVGRDINRPYLNKESVEESLQKPFPKALTKLIRIRNNCDAFNGKFSLSLKDDDLSMIWKNNETSATLTVNLIKDEASICINKNRENVLIDLKSLLLEK